MGQNKLGKLWQEVIEIKNVKELKTKPVIKLKKSKIKVKVLKSSEPQIKTKKIKVKKLQEPIDNNFEPDTTKWDGPNKNKFLHFSKKKGKVILPTKGQKISSFSDAIPLCEEMDQCKGVTRDKTKITLRAGDTLFDKDNTETWLKK